MYRKLFQEIDSVDLDKRKQRDLKPVDESAGEIIIGKLEGNLLRHRVLIEDYHSQYEEILAKFDDAEECHKVDHGNDNLTQGELKRSCEKHNAILASLEKEAEEVIAKFNLLVETFGAELHEEFPESKNFSNIDLREGDMMVGLGKKDSSASSNPGILFAVLRSMLS